MRLITTVKTKTSRCVMVLRAVKKPNNVNFLHLPCVKTTIRHIYAYNLS